VADGDLLQLGLDCSSRGEGVAVLTSPSALVELRPGLQGVASVAGAVRELVGLAGPRLSGVVAARGPGSYMGVRSALAAAIGLAQARRIPLGLVGSLLVVAHRVDPRAGQLLVAVGAGRGGLYLQRFAGDLDPGSSGWREVGQALAVRAGTPFTIPQGCDLLLDPSGVLGGSGLEQVDPVRSGAEALALVIRRDGHRSSGYDLVSADYGARQGDAP
jgi:hypothetical protein